MRPSRRSMVIAAAAAATLIPASTAVAHDSGSSRHRVHNLLRAPIAGSLTDDPPIFGVSPGGAPWVIDHGSARLRTNGWLEVRVDGLVIPPPAQPNVNPVPRLAASVACNARVVATTRTVPFSRSGDARISARVKLPKRCIAPVVLLNPNGNAGTYIGITGVEE